ncbi:MAG TPA: 4a-hydroxytetrahydrobiopterin dehydratase [Verrucomicrobiae bacterium]|nr:4a-hydroxytetrahydrobiopterin dehydratase [Verrucomicrobiae bacterium]
MSLAEKHCAPCRGGVPALEGDELEKMLTQISGWQVVNQHHLTKSFSFPDFRTALEFVNRVGGIAEAEGHHPDLFLAWGKVDVKIWTHKVDGLTESDFILADKIDQAKG